MDTELTFTFDTSHKDCQITIMPIQTIFAIRVDSQNIIELNKQPKTQQQKTPFPKIKTFSTQPKCHIQQHKSRQMLRLRLRRFQKMCKNINKNMFVNQRSGGNILVRNRCHWWTGCAKRQDGLFDLRPVISNHYLFLHNISLLRREQMFQFGNSDPNTQITYYSGVYNQLQAYRTPSNNSNQRTLENLKLQTESLVSEVSTLKQVMGSFITSVRQSMDEMAVQLAAIKKAAETQRPKKKFKKLIQCQFDDCGRKYSSKIALNCHIRNKHPCEDQ